MEAPITRDEAFTMASENLKARLAWDDANQRLLMQSVEACNAAGHAAIRASTLINGGGAVALLAFIGHLASSPGKAEAIAYFAMPLSCFVTGALVSVCAQGFTYLGQLFFGDSLRHRISAHESGTTESGKTTRARVLGHVFNWAAILTVAASLALFARGTYVAFYAFLALASTVRAP